MRRGVVKRAFDVAHEPRRDTLCHLAVQRWQARTTTIRTFSPVCDMPAQARTGHAMEIPSDDSIRLPDGAMRTAGTTAYGVSRRLSSGRLAGCASLSYPQRREWAVVPDAVVVAAGVSVGDCRSSGYAPLMQPRSAAFLFATTPSYAQVDPSGTQASKVRRSAKLDPPFPTTGPVELDGWM